jgi:hypothetical protein
VSERLDLGNYLPYLLNRVGFALVESFTADALKAHGLTIDMWRVLAALSSNGGQRQVDLSGLTSIDVSTMSRLVSRLVRMGLVTRSRSQTSNRDMVETSIVRPCAFSASAVKLSTSAKPTRLSRYGR